MKRVSTMWTTVARRRSLSEKGEQGPCFGQGAHLITSLRGVYSQHRKPAKLRRRLRSTLRRFRVPASGRREGRQSEGESNESCGDRGARRAGPARRRGQRERHAIQRG